MVEEKETGEDIERLLADEQYAEHPLREALATLFSQYQDHLAQIDRLTSISDGFQTVLRAQNQSLAERAQKQMRQLQKIVRISDQYQEMMRDLNEKLKTASMHDPLTELPNRRLMIERLKDEAAAVERGRQPFSLALIDIDHFKTINDNYGHDIGDETLVSAGKKLAEGLREYDVCARWGGEEFLVLLPETKSERALEITERLRSSIEQLRFNELPEQIRLTISTGIAQHQCGSTFDRTLKRADDALYDAKRQGRNQVVLAP